MNVQHLVSVSGGKDSTSVYLLALESGRDFKAVFADTGNEHPATYEYIADLPHRTGGPPIQTVRADFTRQLAGHREFIFKKWRALGVDETIVAEAAALNEPTGNQYLDLCILKGRFPSRNAQFCTSELKEFPIFRQALAPMLRAGPVLQWLGIRAEESTRRAKQPKFNRHESGSMIWRPIFRWTLDDVWAMHRKHGLAPNPLYAQGMTRVGCFPCINCHKGELRAIAENFPEHIDRIAAWENVVARASKHQSANFFAPMKDPTDRDRPGTGSRIHKVVEWTQTARGGRQFALFFDEQPGGGCSSDLALCET